MADTDRTRRFRRTRPQQADDPAAYIDARAGRRAAPPQPTAAQAPRPAPVQARQDVIDVAAFIAKVDTERSQGRPAPRPQPMQTLLGAFHGSPATQTTVQILAAAATARHFGGEHSAAARKWEKLAQDNAARLDAMRAQQYWQEQTRYAAAQAPPEQVQQRTAERVEADADHDGRVFDAAAALALHYVAVKSLPPFDRLAALSIEYLTVARTAEGPQSPGPVPEHRPTVSAASSDVERGLDADRVTGTRIDLDKEGTDTGVQYSAEVVDVADVSDELQQLAGPPQNNGIDPKLGSMFQSAGRGLATAIGPVHGDDDVAPPLSPVDLSHLDQELLDALGAAMSGHPRSVAEILNIEREPDSSNEATFVPDRTSERGQDMAVTY